MHEIVYTPIGTIHSPFRRPKGTPLQPTGAADIEGWVEIFSGYAEGLKDLEGFSHLFLVYHFHRTRGYTLTVEPFMDNKMRGVFATRSPGRPNPIGLSLVRLDRIEGNILHIRDVDVLEGTPLLDMKPYVPAFDARKGVKIGWLKNNVMKLDRARDDGRFAK